MTGIVYSLMNGDPWNVTTKAVFNVGMMTALRRGPLGDRTDIEVASALAELLHDDLQAYGTDGSQTLDDKETAAAIAALKARSQPARD